MTTTTSAPPVRTRAGSVGAYMSVQSVEAVRAARDIAGHVTVAGEPGLRVLTALAKTGDLAGVDLDPAQYVVREKRAALFPIDWEQMQRKLHLPVVRSEGVYAHDAASLRSAMTTGIASGSVRVVSLHEAFLRGPRLQELLAAVRNSEDALAFTFAAAMDPFANAGAIDGLRALLEASDARERRVELLRTDTTGVAFAALGGALGAIGLSTSVRHHGLPLGRRAGEAHKQRQGSPLAFVRPLLSWQRGTQLGALTPFGGAGVTACECFACDGRDLLRFDRTWSSGGVPAEVRSDARLHDVATWLALSREVLSAENPGDTWRGACQAAANTAGSLESTYKVALVVPPSILQWT